MKENLYSETMILDVLAIKKIEREIGRPLTDLEMDSIKHGEELFIMLNDGSYYDYKKVEIIPFSYFKPNNLRHNGPELSYCDETGEYKEIEEPRTLKYVDPEYILHSQIFKYEEKYDIYFQMMREAILVHKFESELSEMIIRLHTEGKTANQIKTILASMKIVHPNPRYRDTAIGKKYILREIADFETLHNIEHIEFNK